ncbi:copper-binding protein [Chitinimonas lacunae]|uniref:Copper-binding protein n=1 Tax=Chitinimonas lacunae TaxID=1963018 RepID=A0ABV8MVI4_9NEIS
MLKSIFRTALLTLAVAALANPAPQSEGEVRKVDREQNKITIRHGEIANLGMPPMTMVFRVKDPALLGTLKAGDKIRFQAEKLEQGYTVTAIEPQP